MTPEEIRYKIDENNAKIRSIMDYHTFVLNKQVQELLKENEEIQAQCPHKFVDGVCEYCGAIE